MRVSGISIAVLVVAAFAIVGCGDDSGPTSASPAPHIIFCGTGGNERLDSVLGAEHDGERKRRQLGAEHLQLCRRAKCPGAPE